MSRCAKLCTLTTDNKGAVPPVLRSIDPEVETIGMDITQIVDAETMKIYFLLSVQRRTTFFLPMDLLKETKGHCLVDSRCSRTVCGELWMSSYLDSLSLRDRENVVTKPSGYNFRFGVGKIYKS